jgi:hypothetical protein
MMKTVILSTNFAEKGAKPLLRFSHLQINRHDSVGILLIFISRNPGKLFLKNFSFLIIPVSNSFRLNKYSLLDSQSGNKVYQ